MPQQWAEMSPTREDTHITWKRDVQNKAAIFNGSMKSYTHARWNNVIWQCTMSKWTTKYCWYVWFTIPLYSQGFVSIASTTSQSGHHNLTLVVPANLGQPVTVSETAAQVATPKLEIDVAVITPASQVMQVSPLAHSTSGRGLRRTLRKLRRLPALSALAFWILYVEVADMVRKVDTLPSRLESTRAESVQTSIMYCIVCVDVCSAN